LEDDQQIQLKVAFTLKDLTPAPIEKSETLIKSTVQPQSKPAVSENAMKRTINNLRRNARELGKAGS
jgi:hypothetical protein